MSGWMATYDVRIRGSVLIDATSGHDAMAKARAALRGEAPVDSTIELEVVDAWPAERDRSTGCPCVGTPDQDECPHQ